MVLGLKTPKPHLFSPHPGLHQVVQQKTFLLFTNPSSLTSSVFDMSSTDSLHHGQRSYLSKIKLINTVCSYLLCGEKKKKKSKNSKSSFEGGIKRMTFFKPCRVIKLQYPPQPNMKRSGKWKIFTKRGQKYDCERYFQSEACFK